MSEFGFPVVDRPQSSKIPKFWHPDILNTPSLIISISKFQYSKAHTGNHQRMQKNKCQKPILIVCKDRQSEKLVMRMTWANLDFQWLRGLIRAKFQNFDIPIFWFALEMVGIECRPVSLQFWQVFWCVIITKQFCEVRVLVYRSKIGTQDQLELTSILRFRGDIDNFLWLLYCPFGLWSSRHQFFDDPIDSHWRW